MDRTPPTAADIKSLASDVARIRDKANEGFRALATAAAEILLALDAMSERIANVPAVAPEDAFDVALHGAEKATVSITPEKYADVVNVDCGLVDTVRADDGTLPDNLGASPRVVVVSDGTRYAPARRVCGAVFDAGGYSLGCTLAEGHEHPEKHDATPGPCAKAEDAIHAGPDGLKVSA